MYAKYIKWLDHIFNLFTELAQLVRTLFIDGMNFIVYSVNILLFCICAARDYLRSTTGICNHAGSRPYQLGKVIHQESESPGKDSQLVLNRTADRD